MWPHKIKRKKKEKTYKGSVTELFSQQNKVSRLPRDVRIPECLHRGDLQESRMQQQRRRKGRMGGF